MKVEIIKVFHEQKILFVKSVEKAAESAAVKNDTRYVLFEDAKGEGTGEGYQWMEGDQCVIGNENGNDGAFEIEAKPQIMNTLFHQKFVGSNVTPAIYRQADSEASEEADGEASEEETVVTTAKVKKERSSKSKTMSGSAILLSDHSHSNNPRRQRLLVVEMSEAEVLRWLRQKFGKETRYLLASNTNANYSKIKMISHFKVFKASGYVYEANGNVIVEFASVKTASLALTSMNEKSMEGVSDSLALEFYQADNIIDFFTHFGGINIRTFTNWYNNKKKGLRCFLREELVKRLGSVSVYYKVVRFIRFEDALPKSPKTLARRMYQIKLKENSNLRTLFWKRLSGTFASVLPIRDFLNHLICQAKRQVKNGYQRRMLIEYFTSFLVGSSRFRVLGDFPSSAKYIFTTNYEEKVWKKILRVHKINVNEGRIHELLFATEFTQDAYPILYPRTLRMCLVHWLKNGFLKGNLELILSDIKVSNLINQKWRNKNTSYICNTSQVPDTVKKVGFGLAMSALRYKIETNFCESLLQLKATNCLYFYEDSLPQSNDIMYLFPNEHTEALARSLIYCGEALVPKNPPANKTKYICVCYANCYPLEELTRLISNDRGINSPIFLFHIDIGRKTFSVFDGISNWYEELKSYEKDTLFSDRIIKYSKRPLSIPMSRPYCDEPLTSKEINKEEDLKKVDFRTTLLLCRDERARGRFLKDFASLFLRDKNGNCMGIGKGSLLFTRGRRKTKEILQKARTGKDTRFYNASVCSPHEARGMGMWKEVWLIGKHSSKSIEVARTLGERVYTIIDSRPIKEQDEVGCSKNNDSEKPKYGSFQFRKNGYFTVVFREKDDSTGLWKRRVQRLKEEDYSIWKTNSLNFKDDEDEKKENDTIHSQKYEGGCCVVPIIQEMSKRKQEVEKYNKEVRAEFSNTKKRKRLQWNTNRQNLKRLLQNKLKQDLSMASDGKFFYKGSNKECNIEAVLKANEEDEDFVATAQRLLKATTMPKIATQRTELA